MDLDIYGEKNKIKTLNVVIKIESWENIAYYYNGKNGFINPSIFFKQVTNDQAEAENRYKEWYGHH